MFRSKISNYFAAVFAFVLAVDGQFARADGHLSASPVIGTGSDTEITINTVVATVGEAEIKLGHVLAAAAQLMPEQRALPSSVLFRRIVDRLIEQEAVAQSVNAVSPITTMRLENIERMEIANQAASALASGIQIENEAIVEAYEAEYGNGEPVIEYHASHIVVETEDLAKSLIEELEAGASFAKLARDHSTGPSGPSGGDLGWFSKGRMLPAFEAAVFDLDVGDTSMPVQTPFGWHVIRLHETRIPDRPGLQDIAGEIYNELMRRAFMEEVDAIIAAASVERIQVDGLNPADVFPREPAAPDDD